MQQQLAQRELLGCCTSGATLHSGLELRLAASTRAVLEGAVRASWPHPQQPDVCNMLQPVLHAVAKTPSRLAVAFVPLTCA